MSIRAQNNPTIDSISKAIQATTNNQSKANLLCKLAFEYIDVDAKKAYKLGLESVELAQKINDRSCEVAALNVLATLDRNRGDYTKALSTLKQAIQIAISANDTISISKCYIAAGDIYSTLLNYDKAISYYKETLALNGDKKNVEVLNSYSRIGNRLMDKGKSTSDTNLMFASIASYLKAKELAASIHNDKLYVNTFVSLADAYNHLGAASKNTHHLYESLNYSMLSLQLAQKLNLKSAQGISYLNLGEVYLSLNKTIKAIHYFEMAEKIYLQLGAKSWLLNTYELMGKTYFSMHLYDNAVQYINKAMVLAHEQNLIHHLRDEYQLLANMHLREQKFEEACHYFVLYNSYKDSVIDENTSFNLSRFQAELDLQKKNKEIEFLTKSTISQSQEISSNKNQRNYLIILVIIVFIILMVVLFLYGERKKAALEILKAKELAEKAKEAQEQFLANTSHEIRTPMNGIIGMTNHLMETPLSKEQQEYIHAIQESSSNLLSIINELLDLSKIMAKKILFDKQPFELEQIIKNLVRLLEFRALEKKVDLKFQINPAIPKVIIGDAVRLKQILLNLVENSVKFTHNGEIEIKVDVLHETEHDIQLEFSVRDTGIGIPANKLNVIFENFTQVNAKTTRKYGGTGLGLSITKQLVEQQGGTVSVKSKVNVGSTFSFTLSFKKLKDKKEVTDNVLSMVSSTPQANLNGARILVVDDNKINQKVASLTLQKWNVKVELADSANDAYKILSEQTIDLILMDITMPDVDGFEATKYIRTHFDEPKNKTPIIAMTAAAFVGDKEKCLAAGMNEYVSKPFIAEDLLVKIKALLPGQLSEQHTNFSDLTLIYERADGDMQFLKEIIECYILEMPVYIKELDDCLALGDYEEIRKQAHKMKAPIALMGALSLKELYSEIEIGAKQQKDLNELAKQIAIAKEQCLQTVAELNAEFQKLLQN